MRWYEVYCSNCGLKLPDWAHYCERCGARVRRNKAAGDPIERVGLDDTSSMGPLWADDADGAGGPAPRERGEAHGELTIPMDEATVLMDEPDAETSPAHELAAPHQPEPQAAVAPKGPQGLRTQPGAGETELIDAQVMEAVAHGDEAAVGGERDDEAAVGGERDDGPAPSEADVPSPSQEATAAADGPSADDQPRQQEEAQPEEPKAIEVGAWDAPLMAEPIRRSHAGDAWQGRPRPTERYRSEPFMSMKAVAIAAAAAIAFGFLAASVLFGGAGSTGQTEEPPSVVMEDVSAAEANLVIGSLDGWWTTDRTFDGRYWHLQDGIMEVYAADGQLAKQVLLDPSLVERMATGPGGIEGAGYYLRDIAFYLQDDDQDTLHAIDTDGSADETGNLFRSDAPDFMGGGQTPAAQDEQGEQEADASEYMLPESSTRVYDSSELEAMSDHDLFVARNEIYARHGYQFEAGELSEYFSSKSWYHPSDVFNEGEITDIERQNVSAILAIEQARGSQYV